MAAKPADIQMSRAQKQKNLERRFRDRAADSSNPDPAEGWPVVVATNSAGETCCQRSKPTVAVAMELRIGRALGGPGHVATMDDGTPYPGPQVVEVRWASDAERVAAYAAYNADREKAWSGNRELAMKVAMPAPAAKPSPSAPAAEA